MATETLRGTAHVITYNLDNLCELVFPSRAYDINTSTSSTFRAINDSSIQLQGTAELSGIPAAVNTPTAATLTIKCAAYSALDGTSGVSYSLDAGANWEPIVSVVGGDSAAPADYTVDVLGVAFGDIRVSSEVYVEGTEAFSQGSVLIYDVRVDTVYTEVVLPKGKKIIPHRNV